MFLAKTAKQTYDTIAQLAHLSYGQNQNTALSSSPADLDLIGPSGSKHGNPPQLYSSISSTAAETSVETASPQPQLKMSRNSTNNGKRHKNHAGHKASSKHRKNNKGSKANNSHNNNAHQKQRRPRINRAISNRAEWYAVAAMQGRRPHMEDTCNVLTPDPTGPTGGDLLSLFGVFDGHGGKKVAQYLKEHLLEAIVEAYGREREEDGDDPDLQRTPTERLQAVLPRTFLQVDQRCMEDDRLSGSTAVVAIVTESDIVVANVGDSRGIIYRTIAGGATSSLSLSSSSSSSLSSSGDDSRGSDSGDELSTNDLTDDEIETDGDTDTETDTDEDLTDDEESAKKDAKSKNGEKKKKRRYRKKPEEGPVGKIGWWQALSVDHKPNRPDERERVERCGGRVTKRPHDVWRFQSVLAVSRAFGDHGLKAGPGGRGLTALPEIRVIPRQENDLFFVLASDGLWDVYTNEQAARVGRNALLQGGSAKNAAQQVADALAHGAYNKDSLDNITALVVLLEGLAASNSSNSAGDSSSEEDAGDGEGSNNLSAPNSPPLSARSRHSEL